MKQKGMEQMNKFIGSGRLAKDPDVRYTQSGKCVCTFTLAMTEGWGENERSTFLPIVVWDKQGEACGDNLVKGQAVVVEGRISVRNYDGQDGKKRYVTECVAQHVEFGAKPRSAAANGGDYQNQAPAQTGAGQFGPSVPDEEIPF